MKVAIASDHAGFELKQHLTKQISELGHEPVDLGPESNDRVDYPDFAAKVAAMVQSGEVDRGVLVCGSGIGMAMSANRWKGCRAAVLGDVWAAEMTRRHNNANVACFGQRAVGVGVAEKCLEVFLGTEFEGGRHEGRVSKIDGQVG